MAWVSDRHGLFVRVEGRFHRAIDPNDRDQLLAGSRHPARYSSADQPSLYLSASAEGVAAAMIAHRDQRGPELQVFQLEVNADRIFDLRDQAACLHAGIDPAHAALNWQEHVSKGERPASWDIRDCLEGLGAFGLIDPSRKAPGLWHLVLFQWNRPGTPQIRLQT